MDNNLIACVLGACLVFELGLGLVALYQEKQEKIRQAKEQSKLDKLMAAAPKLRALVKS